MIRTILILTVLLLGARAAHGRTHSRPAVVVTSKAGTTVVVAYPQQPQPRKPEPVDHWTAARASYFARMYGPVAPTRSYTPAPRSAYRSASKYAPSK